MPEKKEEFKFTEKQLEARSKMALEYMYFMLFGGSRSGKTFLVIYAITIRALKANGSRHAALRFRFNAIKASIIFDTFPKVMKLCFPGVGYTMNKTDWIVTYDNKSEFWFGGLDDKERTEKILGQEFATIFLNECSQIPYRSVGIVMTRLAQKCTQNDGVPLALRMYFDCNPPKKGHWTYKLFIKKQDPDTNEKIRKPDRYGYDQINPVHNVDNLPAEYLETLKSLPAHLRRRFFDGEFGDVNPNAIFSEDSIDRWRVENTNDLPEFARVVVGVDPSGADDEDNEENDPIGIYVAALGVDGNGYLLEDATVKAGPAVWGKMAVSAYDRHKADIMVGEQNFGGAMVKYVIQSVDKNVNYKIVNASRGKKERVEPFSPLFVDGRVRIVGRQDQLEEEMSGFTTNGYTGSKSPNVADAAFWCLTELFPGIIMGKKEHKHIPYKAEAYF